MLKFIGIKKRNTWDLIWILFRTEFKLKYNDSFLGIIWVVLKPFLLYLILYFVLTQVFVNLSIKHFAIYLFIGQMFVNLWSETTSKGMESFLSYAHLISKIVFPRYVVLISSTLIAIVNFLINCIVLSIFILFSEIRPSIVEIFWFLLCAILLYLIGIIVSMFISIVYVKFRDLKQIWELFNTMIFWLTPVFYLPANLSDKNGLLYYIVEHINPISILLISARDGLIYHSISKFSEVGLLLIIFSAIGIIGYGYYRKNIARIAESF